MYCDFFSNTDMSLKQSYISALVLEMEIRKDYLKGETVETIYFGGGTPSQLSSVDFQSIFDAITRNFDISECKEITLEANPDDMTSDYVRSLRGLPFNRISMGVQSFDSDDLRFLNRRHTREQAIQAVNYGKENGLTNISIDMIYGLPGQQPGKWKSNLEELMHLDIPHISAYHLIYEENTPLYSLVRSGQVNPVEDEISIHLFTMLIDTLEKNGYEQYEISNFARPGFESLHNSSYWNSTFYLGLGPSAHSFNGKEREWNISSLPCYINGINNGKPEIETEVLDLRTRYNDYVITRLRTSRGILLEEIDNLFGEEYYNYCINQSQPFIKQGIVHNNNKTLTLSRKGLFICDAVMRELIKI